MVADLRGRPFPHAREKRINLRIEMNYLCCALHQRALPLRTDRWAVTVVLEFCDNLPRGFQRVVNPSFYWFVSGSSLTKNKH